MADNEKIVKEEKACNCGENCSCSAKENQSDLHENSKENDDKTDVNPTDDETSKVESDSENKTEENTSEKKEEEESADAKYMRLMADFQNFKRRTEKEKSDIYAYANEKIALGLLEVIDNFERALEHECVDKAYAEGMELILKQFIDVLGKSGIEEIKTLGEDFDPNFHNAVMMEDNPEFESGKVTSVLQKGYTLNSKVIRPSMVKVNN